MHETKIEMKLEEEMKPLKKICETLEEAVKHEFEKGIEQVNVEEMGAVVDMLKDIYEAKEKLVKGCYYKQIMTAMEKAEEEGKKEDEYMLRQFKEEYGEDEGKRFYDNWRYKNGRFAPKGRGTRRGYQEMMMPEMYDPEYYRDMDRQDMHKMYYSSGSGNSSGRSGSSGGNSGSGSYSGNSGNSSRSYTEGYNDGEENGYQRGYSEGNRDGRRNNGGNNSRYDRARRGYEESKGKNGNSQEGNSENMRNLEKLLNIISEDVKEYAPEMSQSEKAMAKQKIEAMARGIQ